ncbi:uncharacterized protein METZ01_LOCUS143387 [marine metagenome]|uniref:Uncharacterized protein n=1 Tax=marine metagenome TaxID=408172 RepID=A0A381ZP77_9ZZZZ
MPALGEAFLISAIIASSLFIKLALKELFGRLHVDNSNFRSASDNSAFF